MTLAEGMDSARVRQIGTQLRSSQRRLADVAPTGRASLMVLADAWAGPDLGTFTDRWGDAERVVHSASEMLHRYAEDLDRQADAQDSASEASGGGPTPIARTTGDAASGGDDTKNKKNPKIDVDDAENDTEVQGPLFRDGVSPTDAYQGSLADCWFVASLQAVAATNPDLIEENITDNGDGTYDVTLYEDGEPVTYTVDATVPGEDGDPSFADNSSPSERELWPMLYEKAMAQHMGGEWSDMEFDTPERGIEAITGQEMDTENTGSGIFDWNEPPSTGDMQDVIDDGGQVMLSSHDHVAGRPLYEDGTLATNHIYWVQGTEDGMVQIVNPWDPSADPIELTEEEYQENFGYVSTSRP